MLPRSFLHYFMVLIVLSSFILLLYVTQIENYFIYSFFKIKKNLHNKITHLDSIGEFQDLYERIIESHKETYAKLKIEYFYCEQRDLKGKLNLSQLMSYSESLNEALDLSSSTFRENDLNKLLLKSYRHILNELESGGAWSPTCFNKTISKQISTIDCSAASFA